MNNLEPSMFQRWAVLGQRAADAAAARRGPGRRALVGGDEPDPGAPPSDGNSPTGWSKWALNAWQAKQLLDGRTKFNLGPYLIIDSIGQGGMGQVFKAEHGKMGRIVAVKVLPRDKSTPEAVANFTREIRALARLDHPNLVAALDAGQDGNVYYLVTEYVPGMDLRKLVRQRRAAGDAARGVDHLAGGRRAGVRPRPGHDPSRREAGQRAGHARGAGEAVRPGPGRPVGRRAGERSAATARSWARPIISRPTRSATRGIPRRPGTSTRWAARCITR